MAFAVIFLPKAPSRIPPSASSPLCRWHVSPSVTGDTDKTPVMLPTVSEGFLS